MRTISREEHKLILNLFSLEFFGFGLNSKAFETEEHRMEDVYWMYLKAQWFAKIKDCFPMDEYFCEITNSNRIIKSEKDELKYWTGNVDFSSDDEDDMALGLFDLESETLGNEYDLAGEEVIIIPKGMNK